MTLRTKLILAFLLVSLLPLVGLEISNTLVLRRTLEDAARRSLLAAAAQTASRVDAFVTANLGDIRTEAQFPEFATLLTATAQGRPPAALHSSVLEILNALSRKEPIYVRSYALLDRNGRNVLDTYSPFVGVDESRQPYFEAAMARSVPTTAPVLFPEFLNGEGGLFFACVVRNRAHQRLGVLRVVYRGSVLQWLVGQTAPNGNEAAFATLLDEHGRYLAHTGRPEWVLAEPPAGSGNGGHRAALPIPALREFSTGLNRAQDTPFFGFTMPRRNGNPIHYSAAAAGLQLRPWTVVQARPTAAFLAPVQHHTLQALILGVVVAAAVILAAILMSKVLSRPIVHLTEMASRLAAGDLGARVQVTGGDEIGLLGRTFNTMSGRLGSLVEHLEDNVAELERAGTALRESEGRFRRLVENAADAFFLCALDGEIVDANDRACASLGFERSQLIGMSITDVCAGTDAELLRRIAGDAAEPRSVTVEDRHLRVDGSSFPVEMRMGPLNEGGRHFVLALARDVTERKRAEQALAQSEARYRSLVENTQDAYLMAEIPSGRLLFVNRNTHRLFGYGAEQMLGLTVWDLLDSEQHDTLGARLDFAPDRVAVRGGRWKCRARRRDGELFLAEISVTGVEFEGRTVLQALVRDVTQQEQVRERLQQSQKLEAVGTLASGIAHDFNNILQVVTGYVEVLLRDPDRGADDQDKLTSIERMTARAADLVKRLLTFSRGEEPALRPLDLNREVAQGVDLLSRTIPKMVHLEMDLAADLPPVRADPTQLEQILLNLITNARDAMPDGGTVRITTERVAIPAAGDDGVDGLAPGPYALLCVADRGQGMDPATMERIFEPFFSTKPVGQGTGLGLAMVYGIVAAHGGRVTCRSSPGRGTAFRIYLPTTDEAVPEPAPGRSSAIPPPAHPGARILVVDDEPDLRSVVCETLEHAGYTALTADSGETALAIYREQPADLVILDLGMPGMGGLTCLQQLRAADPGAQVLVASGYAGDRAAELIDAGALGFVAKPYSLMALLERVAAVLGPSGLPGDEQRPPA